MSPYCSPAYTSTQPTPSTSDLNGGSVAVTNRGGTSAQDMIATGFGPDEMSISLHPSTHDFSSPSRASAPINPPRHQHSGSSSGGSLSMLSSPIGTGSNGPYTQQHLRGKKSMPDMRYHSHSLLSVSALSGSGAGAAAASMAMLPSFSGSGSSGLGARQHHHQQQQYGHRAGSGSSSPYDAYSTPVSSPLANNPPGSGSTTAVALA